MSTYDDINVNSEAILTGTLLAIDPSSGSAKSDAGFALYRKGELVKSGTIVVNKKANIFKRLIDLYNFVRCEFPDIDVMAIEKIRGRSHTYLRWSVGVTIVAARHAAVIEVPTVTWKKYAGKDYEKSDEQDAIGIGKATIAIARRYGNNGN